MLAVSTSDRDSLARVLTHAFQRDPLLRWVIPDDGAYERFAQRYFELQLGNTIKAGTGYTNLERTGVATWCNPTDQRSLLTGFLAGLKTIWLLKDNLSRAYYIDELMSGYRPRKHYLHLTLLATSPEVQGSGVARHLVEPILTRARARQTPVYLECSNRENLGFYRQFGFRLVDDIPVTKQGISGPTIWPMTLEH